jgi:hypothetical protein
MLADSASLIRLFKSQFAINEGYIVYEWISFKTGRPKPDRAFIVNAAERDSFEAEFQLKAPVFQRKMARDAVLALVSLIASNLILGDFLHEYWQILDVFLFIAHLLTISIIESRRLEAMWDAPLEALARRAPVPPFLLRPKPRIKPLSQADWKELSLGIGLGVIAAFSGKPLIFQPRNRAVSEEVYHIAASALLLLVVIGIVCLLIVARNIVNRIGR